MRADSELLTVSGREVAVSNPAKVLFPAAGYTKLDVARYYIAVADGALRGDVQPPSGAVTSKIVL
jgi:DNA primase